MAIACATVMLAFPLPSTAASFNPSQFLGSSSPYYGVDASVNFDTHQADRSLTIKTYRVDLPARWHFAIGGVDQSAQPNCAALLSAGMDAHAERIGYTQATLHNDDTRGKSGPIPFTGYLYLLKFDGVTQTATLCSRMSATSSLIPVTNWEVLFQVVLKYDTQTAGFLSWNYASVPGGEAGSRSIFDSPYYSTKNTSILYTRIELNTRTTGNFNTDPTGKKAPIRFAWNPDAIGEYSFTGVYTPCGSGDPGFCDAAATPAVRTSIVRITDFPTGHHPGPTLVAPALWTVFKGDSPFSVRWKPPATAPSDFLKGYVLTVSADYVPNSTRTWYFTTDPTSAGYDVSQDPCAEAEECAHSIAWPIVSDAGSAVPSDANFTLALVALYRDGHRSDGRCDDATATGSPPPCGSVVPSYSVTKGIARSQFMHRLKNWPMVYRKIVLNDDQQKWPGVWQVYVLFADLDNHQFQYVEWKPAGASFSGSGQTVSGSNLGGGVISFTNLSGPTRWTLQAVLGPLDARGVWARMSSSNQIQNADRFEGCYFLPIPLFDFPSFFPPLLPPIVLSPLGSVPCPSSAMEMTRIS